jgi:protein-tyrosine phosphatase
VIDLHSHLLPGVDDGSPSAAVSASVLRRFAADGVECVVLTPHLRASRAAQAPHEEHARILDGLRAVAPPQPELRLGWEIMLDVPGADLRAPQLALGGSRAVLVEFPRAAVPAAAADELRRLRASGIVPVLAHPERYWGCTAAHVVEWRAAGAVIQMDTAGLTRSGPVGRLSRALLEAGLVDLVASDNHGDSRALGAARDWLLAAGASEQAELLTRTNARRLLDGERVLPVPPLRWPRSVLGRLRELFGRH